MVNSIYLLRHENDNTYALSKHSRGDGVCFFVSALGFRLEREALAARNEVERDGWVSSAVNIFLFCAHCA
jgi:hypothetical protein